MEKVCSWNIEECQQARGKLQVAKQQRSIWIARPSSIQWSREYTYSEVVAHEAVHERIDERMCHGQPVGDIVRTHVRVVGQLGLLVVHLRVEVDEHLEYVQWSPA